MDFFTVKTLTFRTLYIFVIIEHGRRKLRHWAVTTSLFRSIFSACSRWVAATQLRKRSAGQP